MKLKRKIHICWKLGEKKIEEPEDRILAVIVTDHIEKWPYILYERIQKDRFRPVNKERDIVSSELPLDRMTVTFHVAGQYRDISVPVSAVSDKILHPGNDHTYLFQRIPSRKHVNGCLYVGVI